MTTPYDQMVLRWWDDLSPALREDLLWALGVCGYEQTPRAAFEGLWAYHQHVDDMLAGRVSPTLGDGITERDWQVLEAALAAPTPVESP